MDVEGYLDQLERMLRDARPVPLSSSVMVGRHETEEVVAGLRASLPDELRQSRWVLKERDEVIDQARREADHILADARKQAEREVSESEVLHTAQREAEEILSEAKEHAKVLRLEAEDYVESRLGEFETELRKVLANVERGRERLRGRIGESRDGGLDTHDPDRGEVFDHESGQ